MPIETIEFNGKQYPAFQAKGNAARWVMKFALEVIQPKNKIGVDIGCNRLDWAFPGAYPIDPILNTGEALNFPYVEDEFARGGLDYVFSSHCLEHLPKWVDALDYWHSRLKVGGVCFLYLPDQSQDYWRPWNNRKHVHSFTPELLRMYFELSTRPREERDGHFPFEKKVLPMWKNVFVSGIDLNNSFVAMAEKV